MKIDFGFIIGASIPILVYFIYRDYKNFRKNSPLPSREEHGIRVMAEELNKMHHEYWKKKTKSGMNVLDGYQPKPSRKAPALPKGRSGVPNK